MENKKRTLIEDAKMIFKGIGIWQKILPNFLPYLIFGSITSCLLPYFPLYMSAEIINELTEFCDLYRLMILAAVTVAGTFSLSVLNRFLTGRLNAIRNLHYSRHSAYLFDAENNFQYEHLEEPETVLARNKIGSVAAATNAGLPILLYTSEECLKHLLNLIVSVVLTLSLFRTSAGSFTGFFAVVNSPLAVIVLIAVIAANALLSVYHTLI